MRRRVAVAPFLLLPNPHRNVLGHPRPRPPPRINPAHAGAICIPLAKKGTAAIPATRSADLAFLKEARGKNPTLQENLQLSVIAALLF